MFILYTLLTMLSSINRETSLIIPFIYLAYHGRDGLKPFFFLLAIWIIITSLLHIVIGSYPHQLGGILGGLKYNLNNLPDAFIANLLLLPLAIAVGMGYKHATRRFKRFVGVSLVYIGAIVVGGSWSESIRLVLPILPIVIPLMIV